MLSDRYGGDYGVVGRVVTLAVREEGAGNG
jgi:hypothetical protein